jgi:hypothetical protein
MRKKKVLLLTNASWLNTGLGRNALLLLKHLYGTGKYDLVHYCTGSSDNDTRLALSPWKCYGAIPSDPKVHQTVQSDAVLSKNVGYGSYYIDSIMKLERPDVLICSDDIWAFPVSEYSGKPWSSAVNIGGCSVISHLTVDSLPILQDLYDIANNSNIAVWASFAKRELESRGYKVKLLRGMLDSEAYRPAAPSEKERLRAQFGIDSNQKVFLYVFRNQVRKKPTFLLDALLEYNKRNPNNPAKLFFHTYWGEGWPIVQYMKDIGLDSQYVLTTYVCRSCGRFHVSPYIGEGVACPYCGASDSMVTSNVNNGVDESEMYKIYGIADACVSVANSGGFEYHAAQSLLCGKILATIPYSYGEDYVSCSDVFPIKYHEDIEYGTNFCKAVPDVESIVEFFTVFSSLSKDTINSASSRVVTYAKSIMDYRVVGKLWEEAIDELPFSDYKDEFFEPVKMDENYPLKEDISDDFAFVSDLYRGVLKKNLSESHQDVVGWVSKLRSGNSRSSVHQYFISVACNENKKNSKVSFDSLLGQESKDDRILVNIPESESDCLLFTCLLNDLREQYPSKVIYLATDPAYFDIFKGNPNIDHLLPWVSDFDQTSYFESIYFSVVLQSHFLNQRLENYSHNSQDKTSINLKY